MNIKQLNIDSIKLDKKSIDHNETYGDLYFNEIGFPYIIEINNNKYDSVIYISSKHFSKTPSKEKNIKASISIIYDNPIVSTTKAYDYDCILTQEDVHMLREDLESYIF